MSEIVLLGHVQYHDQQHKQPESIAWRPLKDCTKDAETIFAALLAMQAMVNISWLSTDAVSKPASYVMRLAMGNSNAHPHFHPSTNADGGSPQVDIVDNEKTGKQDPIRCGVGLVSDVLLRRRSRPNLEPKETSDATKEPRLMVSSSSVGSAASMHDGSTGSGSSGMSLAWQRRAMITTLNSMHPAPMSFKGRGAS